MTDVIYRLDRGGLSSRASVAGPVIQLGDFFIPRMDHIYWTLEQRTRLSHGLIHAICKLAAPNWSRPRWRWDIQVPCGFRINCVAWSPKADLLAGGCGNALYVWHYDGAVVKCVFDAHSSDIKCIGWAPDGSNIVTGGKDLAVCVWTAGGILVRRIHSPYHMDYIGRIAWAPDGSAFATLGGNHNICVWNVKDMTVSTHIVCVALDLAWASDGSKFAVLGNNEISLWTAGGKAITRIQLAHRPRQRSYYIEWFPSGSKFATSGSGGVWLWDIAGKPIANHQHMGGVRDISWAPDGSKFVAVLYRGDPGMWTSNGEKCWTAPWMGGPIQMTAWSPDGSKLLFGTDHQLHVWTGS